MSVIKGLKSLGIGVLFTTIVLLILLMLYASVHLDPAETREPVFAILAIVSLGVIPPGILCALYGILRDMVSEETRSDRMINMEHAVMALSTFIVYTATVYGMAIHMYIDFLKSRC